MPKQLIYVAVALFFFAGTCLFAQFPNYYPAYDQTTMQQPAVVAPRTVTSSVVQTNNNNPETMAQNGMPQGYALTGPGGTVAPMQAPVNPQYQAAPQAQMSFNQPPHNIQSFTYQPAHSVAQQANVPSVQNGQTPGVMEHSSYPTYPANTQQQAYYQVIQQNQPASVLQQPAPVVQQPVPSYSQYSPNPSYPQYQNPQQPVVNQVAAVSHQPQMYSYRDVVQPPTQTLEHPLMPVINWAKRERPRVAQIKDYTAILRKQENINGKLQDGNIMEVKIRHEPFSVYMRFIAPKNVDGQEVLYIEGENNGNMWAHGVGLYKLAGTRSLDPLHPIAMSGCRYPLTFVGILNLVDKLMEVGEHDAQYGNCKVYYYENVKMGNRQCLCIEVVHPEYQSQFRFHLARIYVDNEFNLPVRYESYDWPKKAGQKPELLEAYSYDNLKINVGLTDEDFNILNRNYNF